MEQFLKGAFTLMKSALKNQKYDLPSEMDYKRVYRFGRKMQILPLLFFGMENCGVVLSPEVREQFEFYCTKALFFCAKQWALLQEVFSAFETANIDYMPLKGTLLKELYPAPEMRMMADGDILIRVEQYEAIRPVMQALGFAEDVESDHELIWKKDGFSVELHKRLIPSYNKDYYAYFGDGWQRAVRVSDGGYRYQMSDEDTYVHLLTHFAKHFRDGGIGPRHFVDFFVYREKKHLDENYINAELEKLKLREFHDHVVTAVNWLFADGAPDDVSEYLAEKICHSGPYGDAEAHWLSAALKDTKLNGSFEAGYRRRIVSRFFPSLAVMQSMYPILKKHKVLLPFFWIARWFCLLFCDKHSADHYQHIFSKNANEVAAYENDLAKVGLNYNFQEETKK